MDVLPQSMLLQSKICYTSHYKSFKKLSLNLAFLLHIFYITFLIDFFVQNNYKITCKLIAGRDDAVANAGFSN